MPPKTAATPEPHIGKKIQRIRMIKGIQQKVLADQLGITQSSLSAIESSKEVDETRLQQIADALQMSVEAIQNFNEDAVMSYILNNNNVYNDNAVDSSNNQQAGGEQNNTFNPVEKMAELYERMLEMEREKNKLLEELIKKQ